MIHSSSYKLYARKCSIQLTHVYKVKLVRLHRVRAPRLSTFLVGKRTSRLLMETRENAHVRVISPGNLDLRSIMPNFRGICERLKHLARQTGEPVVDEDRFMDTMGMACDESDPTGHLFMKLFLSECDNDMRMIGSCLDNRVQVSRVCHKWIGRCAQMGFTGLEHAGRLLQVLAKTDASLEEMRKALCKMNEMLESIRTVCHCMVV